MVTTSNKALEKVFKLAKDSGCQFVDLKFIDLPGTWQHYTLPYQRAERRPLQGRQRL